MMNITRFYAQNVAIFVLGVPTCQRSSQEWALPSLGSEMEGRIPGVLTCVSIVVARVKSYHYYYY